MGNRGGGDFNMTERPEDKSNDRGRAISDLERFSWNQLLSTLQIQDTFIYQGGLRFSWTNGQYGQARRLARLDRFYTPPNATGNMKIMTYLFTGICRIRFKWKYVWGLRG